MCAINTRKLAGKVALVTGGSRGIGVAIAKRLAADGAVATHRRRRIMQSNRQEGPLTMRKTVPATVTIHFTEGTTRCCNRHQSKNHIQVAKPGCDRLNWWVQFEFILNPVARSQGEEGLSVGERRIPMVLVRNPRARRYVLRLRPDGSARVTIPRGGSAAEARRFAERSVGWVERELQQLSSRSSRPRTWMIGTEILFRGELVKIEAGVDGERDVIRLANEVFKVAEPAADMRPAIERHLWRLAANELPPRVLEHAAAHQLPVRRIVVRNQRSRWGSCSRHGTISLNWRLIQAPPFVRDYLILHELTHMREMNHSARFWREVERVCPGYEEAERWLKQHSSVLR